jgi:hypothetical protein
MLRLPAILVQSQFRTDTRPLLPFRLGIVVALTLSGSAVQMQRGEPMKTQVNFVERRDRPRVGVMAQLEDITYSILRKHGVVNGGSRDTPATQRITQ